MARNPLGDFLQVYPFWLMDVAPIEPLSLPIFTPLFGFSSITAPEMTVETQEIVEGNWFFKRKAIKRADMSPITCSRGVTFVDSDFWRWINAGVTGHTGGFASPIGNFNLGAIGGVTPRRSMLLIHFFSRLPFSLPQIAAAGITAGLQFAAGAAFTQATGSANLIGSAVNSGLTFAALAGGSAIGPFEFAARLPAKVYVLYGCLPTRYKAGSDFDALSGQVSLGELEITCEYFEEVALAA